MKDSVFITYPASELCKTRRFILSERYRDAFLGHLVRIENGNALIQIYGEAEFIEPVYAKKSLLKKREMAGPIGILP